MSMKQEIASWNGKSSDDIGTVYIRYSGDDSFVRQLIELSSQADLQKGATWLLKHYLEDNRKLETGGISVILKLLLQLESWEAKLHILQCIPYMPIGKVDRKGVEVFLRKCLADNNKFVRAWAYNGFYEIALQYPEYEEEAKKFFEMALRDEAPSVKARVRNIVKKGF